MSKSNKKLYNYIVNTLNISQQEVKECINERVDKIMQNSLYDFMNSNRFEQIVLNKLSDIITNGIVDNRWYSRTSFEDLIQTRLSNEVTKYINDNIKIEFKVTDKQNKIIISKKKNNE